MKADVMLYAGEVTPERVSGRSAAVIDVFRATSVMVEALRNGARAVIPVVEVDRARELAAQYPCGGVILGGERDTVLIEGFDKDNSPLSYTAADVAGKTIILTTTNGTRAICNSLPAHVVYIASFLNMSAVCRVLAAEGRDVALVCSGREDNFTTEDGLCAGAMAGILAREYGYALTDIAELMQRMYAEAAADLEGRLSTSRHYNDILRRGYRGDIDFCLQRDICDIVPVYGPGGR